MEPNPIHSKTREQQEEVAFLTQSKRRLAQMRNEIMESVDTALDAVELRLYELSGRGPEIRELLRQAEEIVESNREFLEKMGKN